MNVLLLGYYGYRNIGDDIFVAQLIRFFTQKKVAIDLLCEDHYYQQLYADQPLVTCHQSSHISKLKRLWLIYKNDYIAWGGGTLNISGSPDSLLKIQQASRLLKKKFGFLGMGLEPSESGLSPAVKDLFSKANFLYLRDPESHTFASQNFPDLQPCITGGDLAFLDLDIYPKVSSSDHPRSPQNLHHLSFSGKYWWGDSRAEFYAQPLLQLIDQFNTHIHLLPGSLGDNANDNVFHEKLAAQLPRQNCTIHTWNQPHQFLDILKNMDFHIGNRLHSIILADILGIPNIGINAEPPKIKRYLQKANHLATERTVEFMDEISVDRINTVRQSYQRPSNFIATESQTAQACLNRIFFD